MKPRLTALLFACGVPCIAETRLVDEIIAKVNGDIVTHSELVRARKQGLAATERDTLREIIDQLLLVQKGKDIGINVESDVSKYMADLQKESGIADPDKFQGYIHEHSGQPFEDFKSNVRNQYLRQRVIRQQVGAQMAPPHSEIEKYYNENKQKFLREDRVFLREILIATEGKDDAGIAAAEQKARNLTARARKGEKFTELARSNSDSMTRNNDGELGGAKREELNPKIAEIVFDAERGFVTDPIRVPAGFLILRVEGRHKAGLAPLEEVEYEIVNQLIEPLFPLKVRECLTKLRYESFLEIKPGYEDSGAADGKNTAWTDPAQLKPETISKEEVLNQKSRRRLLWTIPMPSSSTSSSK